VENGSCNTQFVLTTASLNTVQGSHADVDEFSAMDYTLNIVSKCRFFFIFKHLWALNRSWNIIRGRPGKSWKSPGFFVSKRVGTPPLYTDL